MAIKGWYYAQLEAVRHEMQERDDMFFLYELTAPIAVGPEETINLEEEFGRLRVYNTSINEMWYACAAIGGGMVGSTVFAYIPYQGGTIAFDALRQHAGRLRYKTGGKVGLPIVFFTEESGQSPTIGAQHSDWDEDIYFAHMPGIKTVVPSTVYDAKGFIHAAIRDPDPIVYINGGRLKGQAEEVPDEPYEVPIGEAAVRREGTDLTIVGYGSVMPYVMTVAEQLEGQGVSPEVIDLRSLFPLDRDTVLTSAQKTGKVLTVEPGKYSYGVGAEVIASVSEQAPGTIFRRLAYSDSPPPAAPEMFNWMQVTPERISRAAEAILQA